MTTPRDDPRAEGAGASRRAQLATRIALQRDLRGLAELAWCGGSDSRCEWAFAPIVIKAAGDGKGLGVFAARDLLPGERIVAESPLVHWKNPRSTQNDYGVLERAFETLDASRKAAFWEFGQSHDVYGAERTFKGVWLTNALPIVYDGQPTEQAQSSNGCGEAGVFATISRFNHSCAPCCHYSWNPRLGQMTVHTLTRVPCGEELTISYLAEGGRIRAERQELLRRDFGFSCACPRCALTGGALARSDTLQRAIGDVGPDTDPSGAPLTTSRFGAAPEALLRMLMEEQLPKIWARSTFWSAMEQSDQPTHWAAQLLETMTTALGRDHPSTEALEKLVKVRDTIGSTALNETVAMLRAGGWRP